MHQLTRNALWVVAALVCTTVFASAGAAPSKRATLDQVETHIADALSAIERSRTRSAQIDSEVSGLAAKRDEAKGRLHDRARALYRVRRSGMLPVAGGFDALLGHLSRVQRLSRMVERDLETYSFLRNRGGALKEEKALLQEQVAAAQARLEQWRGKKSQLASSRRNAGMFEDVLRGKHQPERRAAPRYGRIQVSNGWDENGTDFAGLRGGLAFPIQGARKVRNGYREGALGLEFVTQPGTSVRAAADGRVVFSKIYGEYNQMVIVDHGSSFFTVYAGLDVVDVAEGDWISMSARVGTVGDTAALFFEVRRGTRSLDARSWLGL